MWRKVYRSASAASRSCGVSELTRLKYIGRRAARCRVTRREDDGFARTSTQWGETVPRRRTPHASVYTPSSRKLGRLFALPQEQCGWSTCPPRRLWQQWHRPEWWWRRRWGRRWRQWSYERQDRRAGLGGIPEGRPGHQ